MNYLQPLLAILLLTQINVSLAETFRFKSQALQTPVLELYTSEGCSSCPPADHWLSQLTRVPIEKLNVLALALHVDYWDYIGWKDPYASPQYTRRQHSIARANRQNTIYTPEFVLNGKELRGTGNILKNILQANQTAAKISLNLEVSKQARQIDLQLISSLESRPNLVVEFVLFEDNLSNQVNAGENSGATLHHQKVVRYISPLIPLETNLQHQINLQADWNSENLGIAAIVHNTSGDYLQSVFGQI
jgi:hypothetical protein